MIALLNDKAPSKLQAAELGTDLRFARQTNGDDLTVRTKGAKALERWRTARTHFHSRVSLRDVEVRAARKYPVLRLELRLALRWWPRMGTTDQVACLTVIDMRLRLLWHMHVHGQLGANDVSDQSNQTIAFV